MAVSLSRFPPTFHYTILPSASWISWHTCTNKDRAFVSMGRSQVSSAAMAQQAARVPSAKWGCPCSTRSTVRKGDSSAPKREHALHTPKPKDRTWVGYTCSSHRQFSARTAEMLDTLTSSSVYGLQQQKGRLTFTQILD